MAFKTGINVAIAEIHTNMPINNVSIVPIDPTNKYAYLDGWRYNFPVGFVSNPTVDNVDDLVKYNITQTQIDNLSSMGFCLGLRSESWSVGTTTIKFSIS